MSPISPTSLQPIPRESKEKDMAAMLDVIVLQPGGNDVIWKRPIGLQLLLPNNNLIRNETSYLCTSIHQTWMA